MKLGTVKVSLEIVVDLNDPKMIERAKLTLIDDITYAVLHDKIQDLMVVISSPLAKYRDIPDYIKNDQ